MAAEKVQKTVHSISEFIDEISKINATLIRNGAMIANCTLFFIPIIMSYHVVAVPK